MHVDAQVSDRALISRVLDGDPQAADLFVARFTRLVWWILLHQIRLDPEPAEDVYQDVFIHLWDDDYRRIRNWSGDGDFASYLAPIVRHRAIDRLRREKPAADDDPDEYLVDDGPGPDDLAHVEEQRRVLEAAVAALGEQDRELYELRFVRDLSYKEIAAVCGITVNNVGVRLNRLVERLRTAVAETCPPGISLPGDDVRSPGARPSTK